jgi:hypothetical protein
MRQITPIPVNVASVMLVALVPFLLVTAGCGGSNGLSYHGTLKRGPYPSGKRGDPVWTIAVDQDPQTVYVAGPSCRAYKSTDGAAEWRAVFGNDHPNTLFEDCATAIAIGPTGTLYVITASGLFRSTNGGGSWNKVGLDGPGISTVAWGAETRSYVRSGRFAWAAPSRYGRSRSGNGTPQQYRASKTGVSHPDDGVPARADQGFADPVAVSSTKPGNFPASALRRSPYSLRAGLQPNRAPWSAQRGQ